MAQHYTARVAAKNQLTEKVYLVDFQIVNPPTLDFKAGQNIMLLISEGVNRTMSIASPPQGDGHILMVQDVAPMGPGSLWTLGLKIGDEVRFVAPTGGALSMIDSSRQKVLAATGTGIAPFRAMILDFLHKQTDVPNSLLLLYWGLRYETDVYWADEFGDLEKKYPNFKFNLILSKPADIWTGKRGHVTEHIMRDVKDLPDSDFYLCGNKEMIKDVKAQLLVNNVPEAQIKTELFY